MLPLAKCGVSRRAFPGGLCIAVAALCAPCGAGAQAVGTTNGASSAAPSASHSWTATPDPGHRVVLETASGFGVFAAVKGRAVDATEPDRLMNGPDGNLFDESAGLGWRRDNVSAMVGYMHPSTERPLYVDENIAYHRPRGRFGIGLSLHY